MKNFALILAAVALCGACGGGGGGDSGNTPPPPSGPSTTAIGAVQGSGTSSPLDGQTVTVAGIVTGDFQSGDGDDDDLGGFYIQQQTPDSDPDSSEGLFIFDGDTPTTDVAVGDRVEVTGTVGEYFGETQLSGVTVSVTGSGTIQPADLNLPLQLTTNSDGEQIVDLERYEGMLVRFPQQLYVSNLRFLEEFGSVWLAEGGRPEQFTNANPPSSTDYVAHREDVVSRTIVLDDGQRTRYPATVRHLEAGTAADYSLRAGDTLKGLTGNLRYSRGSGGNGPETWRLMPTEEVLFSDDNPRPAAPSVGGSFRVASFNVLNFFSGIDEGAPTCGPQGDQNCRGADSTTEQDRQLAKIATAIELLGADVVGLVELENNDSASIAAIVDAVNDRVGSADYAYLDTGAINSDAIKTGFIYRTASATPVGIHAILDSSVDARFADDRNRPALAQTFSATANAARLTVVVNHLKSKGSGCDADGDPNLGDGQGNCNMTRTNAVLAIIDWIATDPTGSGDPDYLVMGDLNAYMREDPLTAFTDAGLINLLAGQESAYSFNFDAQIGALDHAIATSGLAAQVVDAVEWHINADEPRLRDYNLENGRAPGLFNGDDPYRSSDHDPVVVGLDLTP